MTTRSGRSSAAVGHGLKPALDLAPRQILVTGQWLDGSDGTLPVEDPATGALLCEVADASAVDAIAALDAAVETADHAMELGGNAPFLVFEEPRRRAQRPARPPLWPRVVRLYA